MHMLRARSYKPYVIAILAVLLLASCSQTQAGKPRDASPTGSTSPATITPTQPAPPSPTTAPTTSASHTPEPTSTTEPTTTDTATSEPSPTEVPPVYVLLPAGSMVYPGPDAGYPMLAALSEPITFTVAGASEAGDWLVVNLSPYTTGWVRADAVQAPLELASLPVQAAPEGLATVTPIIKPAITLSVFTGTATRLVARAGGQYFDQIKVESVFFEVHTREPRTPVRLTLMKTNGAIVWRYTVKTDAQGALVYTRDLRELTEDGYVAEAVLPDGTTVTAPVVIPEK